MGKGKATVCAILRAALISAKKEKQVDKGTIESLQEVNNSLQEQINLQSQLTTEHNSTQWIHTI